ncbi:MAG: (2Fe-2S)-binding protein [Lawsonibacter sp.]
MDDELIICRCKEVTQDEILEAIADGATTVDGVKRRTKACMGLCQGKSCGRLVQKIVAQETGQKPADVLPQKSRMPARPVKLGDFGGSEDA